MSDENENIQKLRDQIIDLHNAVIELTNSGAKEKTIIILLSHYTKLPQGTVKKLLSAITEIEEEYFGDE